MDQTTTFFVLFGICNYHITWAPDTHSAENNRIPRFVGGDVCNLTDYPFVVSLIIRHTDRDDDICAGSLLTLKWVVTAAQCITSKNITVTSGFPRPNLHFQSREMVRSEIHTKFNIDDQLSPPQIRYDIALVQVDPPFNGSETCAPVIPAKLGFTRDCQTGKILGNGVQNMSGDTFNSVGNPLRCADIEVIIDPKNCSGTWLPSESDATLLCSLERVGKNVCRGDTGGPLVCKGVLIGIVSQENGCGAYGLPATFTKVERLLDFISAETGVDFIKQGDIPRLELSKGITRQIRTLLHVTSLSLLIFC